MQLLAENKQELIREAIQYYRYMTPYKKCVPYLPTGYASVGDGLVCVGIMAEKAAVGYPKMLPTEYSLRDNVLSVHFTEEEQARLFEID